MPAIAKKSGSSSVSCTDGAKGAACGRNVWHWNTGTTQASNVGSGDVFVENIGAVRQDDIMVSHPDGDPCVPSPVNHAPALSTYSPNVFVNGKPIGRIGDKYDSDGHYDHTIASGAGSVFANGPTSVVFQGGSPGPYGGGAGDAVATNTVVGPGGGSVNTGVTNRVPLNPAPGQPYTVTVTGAPDGAVTYVDPSTGETKTGQVVNGQLSIQLVAPTAVIGQSGYQAVSFGFEDGSSNSGSAISISDAVVIKTEQYIQSNPAWREEFRSEFLKSINADPTYDGVIVTNPGEYGPGQYWYEFIKNKLLEEEGG